MIVSGYPSTNVIVKAELFPAGARALGAGLPYALTVAVFGGSAYYLGIWLTNMAHTRWFLWYVTACIFVSLLVYIFMRETRDESSFRT